nr:udp-sugar transporter sqv-7 [Quercus suber]
MDSTLKFKVTDARSHGDKELVGVGALAMASEKNQKLPVSDPLLSDETHKKASAITTKGAQAAISYMLTAVLLVLFNKAALSSYNFPCVNVITLFQMLCSCSFLYAMKLWKIISFTTDEPQNATKNPATLVPFRTLVHTLPLAFSYLLYMLVSMESVRGISVPMYTTLRRTTVAFTMIVEISSWRPNPSSAVLALLMDLSFDAYAYAVVFIANICTAVYLASIAHIGKSSGLNTFGLMWCNGMIRGSTHLHDL